MGTLTKNSAAPDFTAATCDGRAVALSNLLKDGPLYMVFIRGFG